MFNKSELEQVELSIKEAQEHIDRMEALDRLRDNKDFKYIIEEGYLEREASRLVWSKAEPNLQSEENQTAFDRGIIAIGSFRQYLRSIYQLGSHSKRAIEDHKNTRNEIMDED